MAANMDLELLELADTVELSPLAEAALEGLTKRPRQMSPKWFYDERGSRLFEQITDLPEYYLTRTEIALYEDHALDMVDGIGADAVVVEFGSGSSRKTPLLLDALDRPAVYAPIDISLSALREACDRLMDRYPRLSLMPVQADFTGGVELPHTLDSEAGPRLGFFPGSTLGNFHPAQAQLFLQRMLKLLGPGASLLIGVDTVKDVGTLLRAYDDAAGVTAAFNLNLLTRLNNELDADFDLLSFAHEARWNAELSRIEMHLVSTRRQEVQLCGERIPFLNGESIHTECSYKYAPAAAQALFERAGWVLERSWLAPEDAFAVYRLRAPA